MKKALVVEDNLILSMIYRLYLQNLEYEIIGEVATGEKAIEILETQEVDLIIMDIMLDGEIDGIDAMKEIRKQTGAAVIFASGNSDDLNFKRAMEITNSIFLVKPITESDFSNAVQKSKENEIELAH